MSDYGRRLVIDRPFARTVWLVIEAFVAEGFLLKPTDVARMVKGTTGHELRRYILIEGTHPSLTWMALKLDLDVGVLLPFHIAIYELGDGETVVTVGNPLEAITAFASCRKENPELTAVAETIEDRVGRALATLAHEKPRPVAAA
jgi:uncharacterized protein (DUF302 family)